MTRAVLSFEDVSRSFSRPGGRTRRVLTGVTLTVSAARTVAIMGRSGSGKSTLLNLAAGIDRPSGGRIQVLGRDLARLSEGARARHRRDTVGMVFQFFHLMPHLTVAENVALPAMIAGVRRRAVADRVNLLLEHVGLRGRADERIQVLSGGEMQRVAICRALLRRPPLLLADEPTGNLDDETGRRVMDLLLEMGRAEGSTLVYVTHDSELAALADAQWHLHGGKLEAP